MNPDLNQHASLTEKPSRQRSTEYSVPNERCPKHGGSPSCISNKLRIVPSQIYAQGVHIQS